MSEQLAKPLAHPEGSRFWRIIWQELKPSPERERFALRMAVACTAVVVMSNVFRLPFQDVLPFLILFASKEEKVTTAITCLLALFAITVSIAAALVIFKLAGNRPEFRIPAMALEIFVGMYLFRILAAGPVGFILAFIVSVSQSIVDLFPTPEEAVHQYLWVWAAVALAVCVAWLANVVLFAVPPIRLFWQEFASGWRAVTTGAGELAHDLPRAAAALLDERAKGGSLRLLKLLTFSVIDRPNLRAEKSLLTRFIVGLDKITKLLLSYARAQLRSPAARFDPGETRAILGAIQANAAKLEQDLAAGVVPANLAVLPIDNSTDDLGTTKLVEAGNTLRDLFDPGTTQVEKPAARRKKSLFVADAFTNPRHVQFAVKVTLAGMIGYFFYTASDYFGIHTVYYTPLIIALGSTGATVHKGVLRIIGCSIGVILGLVCTIWIIPRYQTLGMYLFLVFCVHGLAGWIAVGTDRISYLGLQIALAFDLGVLHDYGPATEIDPMRDRFIGIILGIAIIGTVFSLLWPESAQGSWREKLAAVLRAIARLFRVENSAAAPAEREQLELEISCHLAEANSYREQAVFEALLLGSEGPKEAHLTETTVAVEEVYVAALPWLREQGASTNAEVGGLMAREMEEIADQIAGEIVAVTDRDSTIEPGGGSRNLQELVRAVGELEARVFFREK